MYLFTLLLFPCAFAYYLARRPSDLRPRLLFSFAAFVVAALICAFRGFYLFRSPYDGADFARLFAEQWFFCAVFPLLVYAAILLISRDAVRTKIASFVLFMLPFYAVCLPADIFAHPVPLPFFLLFCKPVLYLVMIVAIGAELRTLTSLLSVKGVALAVSVLVMLVELAVPALIETLWYYAYPAVLWCALAVAFIALCALRSHLVAKIREEIIQR